MPALAPAWPLPAAPIPSVAPIATAPQAQGHQQAVDRLTCRVCGKKFTMFSSVRRHTRAVHLGTQCHWGACNEEFGDTHLLERHIRAHQDYEAIGDAENELLCHWPGCGRRFDHDKAEMFRHIKMHNTRS
ncbi:hypothetical protein F4781DRAFT_399452 [Annulohypoxylon bovei var. microspora]|nr:hypothetical protein F4781DRAFT_399452 [Annulohypoxylon bovei var. microspora]